MAIDLKTVIYVAQLSKLKFNNKELKKFKEELGKIIDYMDRLMELKPSRLKEPELTPLRLREDKPLETLTKEIALSNATEKGENYFVVPKIIKK